MELTRRSVCFFAVAFAALTISSTAFAALESHRAAYRLKLDQSHRMSGLAGVDGGLVIEWRRACDGWLSHQRLGFVAATDGGGDFSHDVRFSSWEAVDGSEMRYSVRSYDGERLREEYMGNARILSAESGGVANFTKPDQREVILPPGTVFPADHFNRLLAEADSGASFISHEVFDGWGFDALTQVTSVIGQLRPYEPSNDNELPSRSDSDAWPVSMAYYNLMDKSDLPEFEAKFMLTEEGVLQELLLDYGDFRLKATLAEFERLDEPAC
ncbi:MAG: cell envelope integrity EipB family protein [Alphaproteobacteria bacterium]|nr:cell envelope integrity EipB family protein [Alphaproteobacteria bacterium]